MEALELLGVELGGQRNIARQALQLLHEIPALRQGHASAAPAHLHAGVRGGLLTDQGDQAVVLDLRLKEEEKGQTGDLTGGEASRQAMRATRCTHES